MSRRVLRLLTQGAAWVGEEVVEERKLYAPHKVNDGEVVVEEEVQEQVENTGAQFERDGRCDEHLVQHLKENKW